MLTAIILAGGTVKGQNIPKSLFKVGDRNLLQITLDACERSRLVDEVIVICPAQAASYLNGYSKVKDWIESSEDLIERIYTAIDRTRADDLLILPVDMPFITAEIIDGFIEECLAEPVGGYYPILTREMLEERFPGTKRTYAKLKDGIYTGGNIFLIKKTVMINRRDFIEELYEARKKPFKLARAVGISMFIKGLLRILTVREAEERVSKLVNAPLKAVYTRYPEIGIDIDKPEDVEYVRRYLEARDARVS